MALSIYDVAVPVCTRILTNLKVVLEKAKAHALEHKIEEAALTNARLYPDMFPLTNQVQIASDIAKGGCARLAGVEPPSYEDNEQTFDDLVARVERTLDYIRTLDAAKFDGAETRPLTRPVGGKPHPFTGASYLLQFTLPNVFFHATTAYAILRHNGVPLGKMDYLGPLQ